MQKLATILLVVGFSTVLGGCSPDAKSAVGFRLPDGDASRGREAFIYMQCNQCHTVVGEQFADIPLADPPYVELGGRVSHVKTYGELVTSIINPSHKLADGYAEDIVSEDVKSNMYIYNSHMTVQELIDLVMFLQTKYEVAPPRFDYRVYPY